MSEAALELAGLDGWTELGRLFLSSPAGALSGDPLRGVNGVTSGRKMVRDFLLPLSGIVVGVQARSSFAN